MASIPTVAACRVRAYQLWRFAISIGLVISVLQRQFNLTTRLARRMMQTGALPSAMVSLVIFPTVAVPEDPFSGVRPWYPQNERSCMSVASDVKLADQAYGALRDGACLSRRRMAGRPMLSAPWRTHHGHMP